MGLALQQAQLAFDAGEVPIGAVLVVNNSEVVAAAHNQTETRRNPLCHAELLCISAAAEQQMAWRLQEATLYSSVEPCPMCAGAILQARLARLVYGAKQPRVGADGSWVAMFPPQQQLQDQQQAQQQQRQNHTTSQSQPTAPLQWQEQPGQLQHQSGVGVAHMQANDNPQDDGQFLHQDLQRQQQNMGGQQLQPQQQLEPRPEPHRLLVPVGPHPFHPNIQVTGGVLAAESAALMQAFFRQRRAERREERRARGSVAAVSQQQSSSCACHPGPISQLQRLSDAANASNSGSVCGDDNGSSCDSVSPAATPAAGEQTTTWWQRAGRLWSGK